MESSSKLTTKFITITNAIKHAGNPRELMLYRSMLTADELETLSYVQNIMNCCEPKANSPPTVDVQPIPEKRKGCGRKRPRWRCLPRLAKRSKLVPHPLAPCVCISKTH